MYPFEREMGTLKNRVMNPAKPEASIVQRIVAEEVAAWVDQYLESLKEVGVPKSRHEGRLGGQDKKYCYYGVVEEILELQYKEFKMPLFRSKWVDNNRGVREDEHGWSVILEGKTRILGVKDVDDEEEYDEKFNETPPSSWHIPKTIDDVNISFIRRDHGEGFYVAKEKETSIPRDNVKVSVGEFEPAYKEPSVPVPSQYIKKLGQAHGTFTQWPKNLVSLVMSAKVNKPASKEPNEKRATSKWPKGKECNRMKSVISKLKEGEDVKLQGSQREFNFDNDREITIVVEDINQLLSRAWLNISILQVLILALYESCDDDDNPANALGFMCSEMISETMLYGDINRVLLYMSKSMVYIFDSMQKRRNLMIKNKLNMDFRSYKAQTGKSKGTKLNWIAAHCPQQPGSLEYGYYVMCFMYDIFTKHHDSQDLTTDYSRTESFSLEEINEVKEFWADYFMTNSDLDLAS
ncbi:uncharacterized protein [Spinacia oleracea]|uniref:DUF8039 domain-containing protein n=1 Tax=Spinacia oleracea TaxID=3562 RepID=A0ABM3RJ50_SPIOL|nr:uncharacterized protein LOC130470086 [Spinacia oleracea]